MRKNDRDATIDSPFFSYLLIRDHLLTNILGNEAPEILYWSGKELAQQFPLTQHEDITGAFAHCGFGKLILVNETPSNAVYRLTGELISTRLLNNQVNFELEAGFLAEQLSRIQQKTAEVQVRLQKNNVELIVDYL